MRNRSNQSLNDHCCNSRCLAPPHPDLKKRWATANPAAALLERGRTPDPKRLGFNDGVIKPASAFPPGTPKAKLLTAAADRVLRGSIRVAVVLVDFSDKVMSKTQADLNKLFFSSKQIPTGSVTEYYSEVTNGLITISGTVLGPYRMPQTLAWYASNSSGLGDGTNPFRSPQLAYDAAVAANPNIDFGPYDNDQNGYVDAFIVVHAGQGAEVTGSKGDIWSHKATLATPYAADSTKIFGYLTVPEDSKIGVCAHELGHLLFGFPDLYDTDYSSEGIGNWCLMSGGTWNGGGDVPAHPSAWCKANQGWVSVNNITANGTVTIPDVKTSHALLRVWSNGASGQEYFLAENRQQSLFDRDLPSAGLLVWHCDDSQAGNTDENHYKVGLLQADGKRDLELNKNRGDAGDVFPGTSSATRLDGTTAPSTNSYSGSATLVSFTQIAKNGPAIDANITIGAPAHASAKQLVTGVNNDGRLEVFYVGTNDAIYHDWQLSAGGGWSGENPLGGAAKQIAVYRNADGRLEVFYVGTNNAIYHNWQVSAGGGWSGEVALGGAAKQISVGINLDGRLEVFYVGTNDAIYHNWQTSAGGGWSGEAALGGSAKQLDVARNIDGRLEVFYVGTNNALYHNWQITAGGGWNGEAALGGAGKQLAVSNNLDGRLEVFYVGTNDALYHDWQVTAGGGWSGEAALGGSAKQLTVERNLDGRLEVFYVGTNDALYHNWQTTAGGGWNGEAALGGAAKQIDAARNRDGRLETFYVGTNNVVYHDWQVTAGGGWSGEASL